MRCVFAQNHQNQRDPLIPTLYQLILLSLSLSWFFAKTQRIPDTWNGSIWNALRFCAKQWEWERCTNITISLTLMVLRKNATHSGYMGRHSKSSKWSKLACLSSWIHFLRFSTVFDDYYVENILYVKNSWVTRNLPTLHPPFPFQFIPSSARISCSTFSQMTVGSTFPSVRILRIVSVAVLSNRGWKLPPPHSLFF